MLWVQRGRGVGNMTGFLSFDIKGLFDNIDHMLLLKAVRKHVMCDWTLLYIERWLTAPMEQEGIRMERTRGTYIDAVSEDLNYDDSQRHHVGSALDFRPIVERLCRRHDLPNGSD
jgi:retron-type reverse transcriptase